jgi:hypothetical protein
MFYLMMDYLFPVLSPAAWTPTPTKFPYLSVFIVAANCVAAGETVRIIAVYPSLSPLFRLLLPSLVFELELELDSKCPLRTIVSGEER